jgi:type I restriction enzyme, S subunit
VDALIGALDRLIAKKRNLKQAAMQQLLTGQTRLPGFSGEWEVKRLWNIADIHRGASPRPIDSPIWYDSRSTVGWVRISDIAESDGQTLLKTRDYLSQRGIAASRFLPAGSLIMSICATVGRPVITGFDTCIHDGFVGFSNLRRVDKRFLFYKLTQLENKFKAMGQTGSQANLNTDLVNSCEIGLPEPSEQTAIAGVLSDMDAEIVALEQRLAKTRALKQGMMQELLTGKTRLV